MLTKPRTPVRLLTTLLSILLKFFVPPLVGALLLTIAFTIDMRFDSLTQILDVPLSADVKIFFNNLYTFYIYYLLVYIPFYIYLTVLKAFGKLGLITVLVSGFIYGLSPILFGRQGYVSLGDIVLLVTIVISGMLCSGCYYWLHKKLT